LVFMGFNYLQFLDMTLRVCSGLLVWSKTVIVEDDPGVSQSLRLYRLLMTLSPC